MACKWKYAFNCRDCLCIKMLDDGVRHGNYCMPMVNGEDPIHADDDYIVRCDCWQPAQTTLFDGEYLEDAEEEDNYD